MALDIVLVVVGLIGLFFGAEWLVRGASRLAAFFNLSPLVIGITVVAIGTSAPELIVNVSAALSGSAEMALGNVVGSNIANIGLILSVTALIYPVIVAWSLIKREIPILIGVSGVVLLVALDGQIGRVEGGFLLAGFVAFNILALWFARREEKDVEKTVKDYADRDKRLERERPWRNAAILLVGLFVLAVGAQAMTEGATRIARDVGVSELVIGLTLVAFGTSMPELATAVIAAFRKENGIALGNVVGSNISNMLLILGGTSLITPLPVDPAMMRFEIPAMIAFSLVLLPLVFDRKVTRFEAALLLVAYIATMVIAFILSA